MPQPRFAPTGARTSPGFTPVGTPAPSRALPPSGGSRALFQPSAPTNPSNLAGQFAPSTPSPSRGQFIGGARGGFYMAPGAQGQDTREKIASMYDRPTSTLGAIFRVLRLGENVGVGAMKGVFGALSDAGRFDSGSTYKDIMEALPPWMIVNAMTGGFKEMGQSVKNDITYEDWIEQSNNPDSFLYRHSKPIGIGLSFFGDPLTYVTFGATGVSKTAAQKTLAYAWKNSYDDAVAAIESGARGNVDDLAFKIHAQNNRPFSMGDALDDIRATDRARMGFGGGKGVNLSGNLRGVFARGGRGLNFAGQEVLPGGTMSGLARSLPVVGKKVGEPGLGTMAARRGELSRGLIDSFSMVIPQSKLLGVTEDARRFAAMHEMGEAAAKAAELGHNAVQDALRIFEVDPAYAQKLQSAPSHVKRAEMAIRNIFPGSQRRVPYVPAADRKALLTPGFKPTGPYAGRLQVMRMEAVGAKTSLLRQAEDAGFDKTQLKNMNDLWDRLVREHADPIEVMSRFSATVVTKMHTAQALDGMLANPMFARIDISNLEQDFVKHFDDYNTFGDNLAAAKKKLKNAKTPQAKASNTRAVNHWQRKFDEVKPLYEEAKLARNKAKKEAKGRAVADPEAWGRSIYENAVPFTWKKQKYMVPQPIADAMELIKNPKFLDLELKKAFRTINWTQNKWKVLATSVNPAFHFMNMVGGMWNNMLGGIYNPGDYLQTMLDTYRYRALESENQFSLLQKFNPLNDTQRLEVGERIQAFEARGAGGGLVAEEMGQKLKDVLRPTKTKSGPGRAFTRARRAYGAAALAEWAAPDEWVPDDVEIGGVSIPLGDALNPLIGAGLLMPEFMRAGSVAANDVEESLRMTPFRVAERDPTWHQIADAYSLSPPAHMGKWMDMTDLGHIDMGKELAWDIGAALAMRFQFDYSNLTHFERYVAKSIFPFYTFYKNNFVLQVVENVQRPRFLNAFESVANYSEYISDDESANNPYFKEMLPEYFDKLAMFQIPVPGAVREVLGLPQDQPLYLNPKLPFSSLNLFPPLWQFANDNDMQPTGAKMLGMFAPMFGSVGPFAGGLPFKVALEYSVGQQLGLARPIDFQRMQSGGWRQSSTDAPGYVKFLPGPLQDWFGAYKDPNTGVMKINSSRRYLLDQLASPFITGLGEPLSLEAQDAPEKAAANTIAWMTGIRMTPVDPLRLDRGWLYRTESFLEGQRAEKRERGLDLMPEDAAFLREIRAQIRVTERAWDEKQEELYGRPDR